MSADHHLQRYLKEHPEFIDAAVERTVGRYVEEMLEDRRGEIERAVEQALAEHLHQLALREFLDVFLLSEKAGQYVKPLGDAVRDATRARVARSMRFQWQELAHLKVKLRELREVMEGEREPWTYDDKWPYDDEPYE
ncbi:hypothetical protein NG895_02435 [Aeoliella sp. ICT_H6.2]|uniref:Uncharacterized protein n=1 Tax=Aeoliella straminimaris TaxID=2954799 RepID=A0A9X2F5T2_9BACT|nr:hypothetical protein [Aeoliella straminimaris]MCO6042755.1 hypothetical protein [Aeoliella straminimaris]